MAFPNCPGGNQQIQNCVTTPWNLIDKDAPELELFKSAVEEYTELAGFPIDYYVTSAITDQIYGENSRPQLSTPARTKAVYNPQSDQTISNAFGLMGSENIQFLLIPASMFTREVSGAIIEMNGLGALVMPKPGDIIKILTNLKTFQITHVSNDSSMFIGQRGLIWDMTVTPFSFSEQSKKHKFLHTNVEDNLYPVSNPITPPVRDHLEQTLGDNEKIEEESETIDNYANVDTKIFGY